MLDLIHIWSRLARKGWAETGPMILALWLACRPDPFGQNLTQPEPNPIHAGFAQYDLGCLRKNTNEWKWETGNSSVAFCQNSTCRFLHTSLLWDQICLASTWPGHPDQIWAGFAQRDRGLLPTYSIWPDSGCMLAITGCNQNSNESDPACLLSKFEDF